MMGNFDLCKFILQHVDKKDPMDNRGEAMAKAMGYLNVIDLIDSYLSPKLSNSIFSFIVTFEINS